MDELLKWLSQSGWPQIIIIALQIFLGVVIFVGKNQIDNSIKNKFDKDFLKFSSLFQKRAEVIGELYGYLADINVAFNKVVDTPNLIEYCNQAIETAQKTLIAYSRNKIYFDEKLLDSLEIAFSHVNQMKEMVSIIVNKYSIEEDKENNKELLKQLFYNDFQMSVHNVELEFRKVR